MSSLRTRTLEIFNTAVRHADPYAAVGRYLIKDRTGLYIDKKVYDLRRIRHIFLVGAGKAGVPMARAVEDILGDRLYKGMINVKYGRVGSLKITQINEAGHPVPDENGIYGSEAIVDLIKSSTEDDLIICVISGGGSSLLPMPCRGISLYEKKKVTRFLLASGASIHEINIVRKHISSIKGGKLAEAIYPSHSITLILSDVIGDNTDTIASGPTAPDISTYYDTFRVLEKYDLVKSVPPSIIRHIKAGMEGKIAETPEPGNPVFSRAYSKIVANNLLSINAAKEKAKALGFNTLIVGDRVEGDTIEAARMHTDIVKNILHNNHPVSTPACIISGGETTVKIKGKGKGGRNQEFVLAAAMEITGLKNVAVLSCGTDGIDGPTDAAGAIADGFTIERGKKIGKNAAAFLEDNNSYNFFRPLNDLIITGPTLTNVMDIRVIVIG